MIPLAGCGDKGGPDPKAQAQAVDYAKSLRSYFDKANGDYSALNDADRAAYVKLAGGEDKAKQFWDGMKNGPGSAPRGGAPGQ